MATTTNYSWTTPDDTDLVKDGAAAIRTLGSSIDTTTKNLNPSTTLGDIEYRSSTANTNTRLPIGSSGQVLTVAAGVPSWATPTDQTPLTTKGDIFTFTTTDARLGVGTNGQYLSADSAEATGLKWVTPAAFTFVGADVYSTASQNLTNNTVTVINFGNENFDTDGFHDNTTNNSRMTVPSGKAGKYQLNASCNIESNATGNRYISFLKNGVSLGYAVRTVAISGAQMWISLSAIANLAVGDYVEVEVFQNSGGTRTSNGNYFSIGYLGA